VTSLKPYFTSLSVRIAAIKVVTAVCMVAAWQAISMSGLFYHGIVPSVPDVVWACVSEILDPSFYVDLGYTLFESLVGFFFGAIIAVAMGIGLGSSSYARRMFEPYINAIGGTPKIVFLPIIFLIFGLGIDSKIAKAALSAFFPVVLSTTSGFIQIPPVLIRVGKSFGLNRWQMVSKIYLPAMSSPLMTGFRLGIAMSIIGVLAAEIAYANVGLGHRLIQDADQFKIPSVYAITILIFATSALINSALTHVQQYLTKRGSKKQRNTEIPQMTAVVRPL
jgi:ABC-type nitrate/sulfonate/bicarbonate transport system permease component